MPVAEIAERIGITTDTVYRWKRNPLFMQEIRRLQADRFAKSSAKLQKMVEKALSVLEKKQTDPMYHNDIRISLALLRLIGANRILGLPLANPSSASIAAPKPAAPDTQSVDA